MTFSRDQTFLEPDDLQWSPALYGSQRKTISECQTNFSGDQISHRDQTETRNEEDTLQGDHMMPHSSSLPFLGFWCISNSHLIQGQSLEQRWNLQIQSIRCRRILTSWSPIFVHTRTVGNHSKSSHLWIHECRHPGEKPYKCNANRCTWGFSHLDELNRHKGKHTGERPYLCTQGDRNAAPSDHLEQHQSPQINFTCDDQPSLGGNELNRKIILAKSAQHLSLCQHLDA